MGYSSDERRGAVSELVQGTLTFTRDRLGARDITSSYDEVTELVNSALLYDPDAIFYLMRLVANSLNRLRLAEVTEVDSLLDYVDDLARSDLPVEEISHLTAARRALLAMEGATARSGAVGASEYRSYTLAIEKAKNALGRAAKLTYTPRGASQATRDIVRPYQEAKALAVTTFRSLRTSHAELVERVRQALLTYSEFLAGNLEGKVGSRQLVRAAQQLGDLYDTLQPLTPHARTEHARDGLLKVLANQSTVRALAERTLPGEAKLEQEVGAASLYRLSAYGTGTAAELEGTVSQPWPLQDGVTDTLELDLNGSTVNVDLFPAGTSTIPGIQSAQLDGGIEGPFAVAVDLATPHPLISATETYDTQNNGDTFHITVDGVTYYKAVTSGLSVPAATIVTDLSAAAGWVPSQPEVTFSVSSGRVQVAYSVASPPTAYGDRSMEVVQGFGYAQDLWPWTSGPLGTTAASRSAGWDDNTELWIKGNDDPDYINVDLLYGVVSPEGDWPDYEVSAATVADAIDAAATAASEDVTASALSDERVRVSSELLGEGSIVTILSDGLRQSPDAREGVGTPSYQGMITLGFAERLESRQKDIDGLAVINVLNQHAGSPAFPDEAVASLERSALLNERRVTKGTGPNDIDIAQASDPVGAWPALGELKAAITNGDNRGVYGISSSSFSGGVLTLTLDRRLRDTTVGLQHRVIVYREVLKVTSSDSSLSSSVEVQAVAQSAHTVLGLDTLTHTSSVSKVLVERNEPSVGWKSFDMRRHRIKVGDKILNGIGTEQTAVSATGEAADGILGVSPEVDPSLSLSSFSIESAAYLSYQTYIAALEAWLDELDEWDPKGTLDRIDRALTPLFLLKPNRDAVDAAYSLISDLRDRLADSDSLETVLSGYEAAKVLGVDRALQALLEHGHDRVRVLLLEGYMEDFFASTSQTASYGGEFLTTAAEVVVEDINEDNAARARHDAEFMRYAGDYEDDTDPIWDLSDKEDELPYHPLEDHYHGWDEDLG